MRIIEFAEHLEKALLAGSIPKFLKNEEAFERDFIAPIAVGAAQDFPDVHLFTHSYGNRSMCPRGCVEAEAGGNWLVGCPNCWKLSKSWATVSAFGMRHTFDMVAQDRDRRTAAVEVKWMRFTGKRAPNGEFQRFLGQCAIAASRHDVVIGVAGIRGGPSGEELRYDDERKELLEVFEKLGVRLLILKAPDDLGEVEIAAI